MCVKSKQKSVLFFFSFWLLIYASPLSVLFLALASTLSYARSITSSEIITSTVVETEQLVIQGSAANPIAVTITGENALLSMEIPSVPQYSLKMNNYSTVTLEKGGSIDMNSPRYTDGGFQLNGIATLIIESDAGTLYTDKVAFTSDYAVLTINKANAIVACSAKTPYVHLTLPSAGTINMNASQAFSMDIRLNVTPTFKFANGAVLSIMGWTNTRATCAMKLVDFVDNSIFLSDGDGAFVYRYEGNTLTVKRDGSTSEIAILDANGNAYEG